MKRVIMDNEVLAFALQRCEADHALGLHMMRSAPTLSGRVLFKEYVQMVDRLRLALESARDE